MYSQRTILVGACALLLSLRAASAQGTLQSVTVTFDGAPPQPPGSAYLLQSYRESGVWFAPIPNTDGFARRGSSPRPGWPDDGTAYLEAGLGDSLLFGLDDGSSFDPVSVDLAEFSAVERAPVTVHFVGYRQDGTVLTDDITTAGIFNGIAPVFQTFHFDPGFSNLVRVEIPYPLWSLDNLVVSYGVPEPGTATLVKLGIGLLGLRLLRPNKSLHSTPR